MKLDRDNSRFVCAKCYIDGNKCEFEPDTRIMFTHRTNKHHDKDAVLMPCKNCGETYWVWNK